MTRDRARREIRRPARYDHANNTFFAFNVTDEFESEYLVTYKEAVTCKEKESWKKAMDEEMESLLKNQTWILVKRPKQQKLVSCKWIFKRKGVLGVENTRFKARLVARGFTQEGVDYKEIYSPIVRHTLIRVLLALVAQYGFCLEQLHVKIAFLHANLEEKIFMAKPKGYVRKGDQQKFCLLKKSLYGLKQSPRQWYMRFDDFMVKNGYVRSCYDNCVYHKWLENGVGIFLLLYVDDILIASIDREEIEKLKMQLSSEFEMKDLGRAKKILAM